MYRSVEERRKIRNMFSAITGRYDFLNRLLSFGQDAGWRRKAVEHVERREGGIHLDLACGTVDVGLEVARQIKGAMVIGGDISLEMLLEAGRKVIREDLTRQFSFVTCAGESLPFRDRVFDSILIAFGIRNVVEREKALREMARTLKEEGTLVILEFSLPGNALVRKGYLFYFQRLLPLIAGIFSDRSAYAYLTDSVLDFPDRQEFIDMMVRSGFPEVTAEDLTLGIVTLYRGRVKRS